VGTSPQQHRIQNAHLQELSDTRKHDSIRFILVGGVVRETAEKRLTKRGSIGDPAPDAGPCREQAAIGSKWNCFTACSTGISSV